MKTGLSFQREGKNLLRPELIQSKFPKKKELNRKNRENVKRNPQKIKNQVKTDHHHQNKELIPPYRNQGLDISKRRVTNSIQNKN